MSSCQKLVPHPLGIRPFGNYFLDGIPSTREAGLGIFAVLSDELLLRILEELDSRSLARMGTLSHVLYCIIDSEEIWKRQTLEAFGCDFDFFESWKQTFVLKSTQKKISKAKLDPIKGFYSDLLYQPWFCTQFKIPQSWLTTETIPRRFNLELADFRNRFEIPNQPVILKGCMEDWSALKLWNRSFFSKAFENVSVLVGNYEMQFDRYLKYCDAQKDDMPLYLFDKEIFKRLPELNDHFHVPDVFEEDLFECLKQRPDHKWLIMGPERSGSSFHKDPNSTSAWNAVLRGSKKWILFPPFVLPPGVYQNEDGSEVATPVSLIEWFLNFYEESKSMKVKPHEAVVREGEILFVPRGWWHLALNLEESIAITQNFVSSITLSYVLKFLKTKNPSLVSGIPLERREHFYDEFIAALQEHHPELLKQSLEPRSGCKRTHLGDPKENSKREHLWEPSKDTPFKFNFSQKDLNTTSFP